LVAYAAKLFVVCRLFSGGIKSWASGYQILLATDLKYEPDVTDLPPELGAEFLSFLREVNDHFEVADTRGLVSFIVEHAEQYPFLLDLIEINWDAVVERFERTGEVPPGIQLTRTATREASSEHAYLEQYRRMIRSYERFASIDRGRVYEPSSENYEDEVFAFFLNCYHLKDWIKNDERARVV
jgi:hypothetical protein